MNTDRESAVRRWGIGFAGSAFAVALGLLYVLVLRSIAVQISPQPPPLREPYPDASTEEKCAVEGGRWITQPQQDGGARPIPVGEKRQPYSYCQGPLAFERERIEQEERSRQTSLFVFAIGGGLAVAAGVFFRQAKAVSAGVLLGGIASFFIAGIHVWQLAPGIGRLVTIVSIFLILVGIGLYTFREQRSPSPHE